LQGENEKFLSQKSNMRFVYNDKTKFLKRHEAAKKEVYYENQKI